MDDVSAHKTRLRKQFRAWRMALDDDDYARRSAAIVEQIFALPEVQAAQTVHVFAPLIERREPDLRPLIAHLRRAGARLVVPHVVSLDPPVMTHRLLVGDVLDAAGLPSADGPEVPPDALDVAIVPALAADRRGIRLGYGKGFYDRMLAGLGLPTVCPVFHNLFVDALPADTNDVPVRCVVTEHETWRVPGRS